MADIKSQNFEVVTEFGERLTDIRKEKGLTQQELADKMGVSVKTINKYENDNDKDLSFFVVKKLASILNVSIDYLAGYKTNKSIQDASLDTINLTKEAVDSISNGKYDHAILSDILSHPQFYIVMLDIMVLLSQDHAINMIQRDSTFEYARKLVFEKTGGQEDFNTKLLELSDMDEDIYVMNVIHKDLDIILNDLKKKYIPKDIETIKEFFRKQVYAQLEKGFINSQESTAIPHSPEHLLDILLGQLGIPLDKISAEQKEQLIEIVKLSPLLKSAVSLRGKT